MGLQGWYINSWKRFANGSGNFRSCNEEERFGNKTVITAKIDEKEQQCDKLGIHWAVWAQAGRRTLEMIKATKDRRLLCSVIADVVFLNKKIIISNDKTACRERCLAAGYVSANHRPS